MPRVGFDEHMPARQLTLAQVGGILEFAPAQPVTGKKRVHVSDNTRNGRRAQALAARPPRGRATAAHGRNGRHAVATAAQQDGAAAVGGQGEQPKVEVQETTPVVQPVQQVVATPSKNPSTCVNSPQSTGAEEHPIDTTKVRGTRKRPMVPGSPMGTWLSTSRS